MSDGEDGDLAQDAGVPASMSDLFFTLIAVVVLMLLALVPAIRTPGALAPERTAPWRADLAVDGREVLVLAAQGDGLLLRGEAEEERLIPLDAIFTDAPLKAALGEAQARGETPLLFVAADGSEAVFLFDALAGSLGIQTVDQVRIDRACRFAPAAAGSRRFCDPDGWAAP